MQICAPYLGAPVNFSELGSVMIAMAGEPLAPNCGAQICVPEPPRCGDARRFVFLKQLACGVTCADIRASRGVRRADMRS